ncbi:hypothetical protein J6590_026802 [Homalodisca vitripennis]|nr:hypothetical protein J6590_026802 [Homalodisca vitripennis]
MNKKGDKYSPISPEEEDSVKEGVPSVQVGVEPSTDAGGVQVRCLPVPVTTDPIPDVEDPDSTLSEDLFSDPPWVVHRGMSVPPLVE